MVKKRLVQYSLIVMLMLTGKELGCVSSVGFYSGNVVGSMQVMANSEVTGFKAFLPGFLFSEIYCTDFDARDAQGNKVTTASVLEDLRNLFLVSFITNYMNPELRSIAAYVKRMNEILGLLKKHFGVPLKKIITGGMPAAMIIVLRSLNEFIRRVVNVLSTAAAGSSGSSSVVVALCVSLCAVMLLPYSKVVLSSVILRL
ncbi:MAG: hypothetical protein WC955_06045 [Elusimicrobiota bacterium]